MSGKIVINLVDKMTGVVDCYRMASHGNEKAGAAAPAPPASQTSQKTAFTPQVRRIAVVVVIGAVASLLDSTIVNIALRTLAADFRTSLDTIQWVVTAYLLALGAVIPLTGWLARRVGARRLYLGSIALFTLGSVLCGAAHSVPELIIFRAIQGIGGGMTLPVGQIILAKKAGPQNMARVMSVIGIPMVLTPVIGPTIGGLLLQYAGWRWIFFVNLPIGLAGLLAGWRLLPRDHAEDAGPLDVAGLIAVSAGTTGITYGLAELGSNGRATVAVIASLAAGLVLVLAFVLRALRVKRPLLDVRLYRDKAFAAASVATFCLGGALYGGMLLMPLYFQTVGHESVVTTGLLLGPSGFGAAAAMWLSGRSTERLGSGMTAIIGGVINMIATLPFVFITAHSSYVLLCSALVVRGFGIGMSMVPAMTAAYRVLGREKINDATPQLSVLQRIGGSMGTAIIVVVLQSHLEHSRTTAQQAHGFGVAFWWVLAVTAVALLSTVVLAVIERPVFAAQRAARGGLGAGTQPAQPASQQNH